MFDNYLVGVWNRGPSTKVNDITIPGVLAWVRDVMCDVQPYSQELLLKTYGYSIQVTKRFFIDEGADISIGTVLMLGTQKHEVKKIIEWDYIEAMTLEVT
jgi:hypothetical protein